MEWATRDKWHLLQQQLYSEAFWEELQQRCIRHRIGTDILRWGYKTKGMFSTKESYQLSNTPIEKPDPCWSKIWDIKSWPKVTTFLWLVLHRRILTWENLIKRGSIGPSQCHLCKTHEENMEHILNQCPLANHLWTNIASLYKRTDRCPDNVTNTMENWHKHHFQNPILNQIW